MNFLLEIGVEELPAEYARAAWQQLFDSKLLREALGAGAEVLGGGGGHYTPRRIAFFAGNVPEKHPDLTVNVSGPAKKVAFDADGKPTKALVGFLRGQGITLDQVRYESLPRANTWRPP